MLFSKVTTKIRVEGMMCQHCAAHAKEALLKIKGVKDAIVDLSKKEIEIISKAALREDELKAAIEGAGYSYKGIING